MEELVIRVKVRMIKARVGGRSFTVVAEWIPFLSFCPGFPTSDSVFISMIRNRNTAFSSVYAHHSNGIIN